MTSPEFDRTLRGALSIPMSQAQETELDSRLTARLAGHRKHRGVARLPRVPRLAFGLTMAFVLLAGSAVAGERCSTSSSAALRYLRTSGIAQPASTSLRPTRAIRWCSRRPL